MGIARDGGVIGINGDILNIIEPAEEVHLGELADAGYKYKADVSITILNSGVEILEYVPGY